jgi:hypothetical protein
VSDEQINIAIAESLGWESCGMASTGKLMGYKTEEWERLPDYIVDLNVCHEFEKTLDGMNQISYLAKLHENNHYCSWGGTCATARQRCEAYLRTLGKWKE